MKAFVGIILATDRTLADKVLRAGFSWPTMIVDARKYVNKCDKCQRFAPIINLPANELQPIFCPHTICRMGMDILGSFTTSTGSRKFLIIGIDYFKKWM